MQEKTCTKCGNTFPATLEFFYKNSGGKHGVTPRCKSCVNADNLAGHAKRLAASPEKVKALANARSKKHYHGNLEKARNVARASATKARQDPTKYAKIQSRKRAGGAGLSVEEIQVIRDKQGNACAICNAPNPTDLDHCHATGTVRWLLCTHCNRGLGAFRDSPELLKKAADMLKTMNQENKPVPAKSVGG